MSDASMTDVRAKTQTLPAATADNPQNPYAQPPRAQPPASAHLNVPVDLNADIAAHVVQCKSVGWAAEQCAQQFNTKVSQIRWLYGRIEQNLPFEVDGMPDRYILQQPNASIPPVAAPIVDIAALERYFPIGAVIPTDPGAQTTTTLLQMGRILVRGDGGYVVTQVEAKAQAPSAAPPALTPQPPAVPPTASPASNPAAPSDASKLSKRWSAKRRQQARDIFYAATASVGEAQLDYETILVQSAIQIDIQLDKLRTFWEPLKRLIVHRAEVEDLNIDATTVAQQTGVDIEEVQACPLFRFGEAVDLPPPQDSHPNLPEVVPNRPAVQPRLGPFASTTPKPESTSSYVQLGVLMLSVGGALAGETLSPLEEYGLERILESAGTEITNLRRALAALDAIL